MSAQPYPAYRDSGALWLGSVPAHWNVRPVRHFTTSSGGGTPNREVLEFWNGDIPWVSPKDMKSETISGSEEAITLAGLHGSATSMVEPGAVLLVVRSGILKHTIPVAINVVPVALNQDMKALRPDARVCLAEYFARVVQGSNDIFLHLWAKQGATVESIEQDYLNGTLFPLPPLAEQSAIAAFLDRETGKIDGLVAEQERLMALLKEKRQAVISQAVTKGLNPNAPMKPSGVEWLGDVPEGWVALQLGRLCTKISDGPHFSPSYLDAGVMFLSARNIKVNGWSLDDAKFISEDDYEEFCRRIVPEIGDVLYTKGGTTGIAKVVDLEDRFQVWVHVAVLKIDRNMARPHYVAYALNSVGCYEQSQLHTRGATNQDLGLTRMIKIWLTLPSLDEQDRVVAYLDDKTRGLDVLVEEATRAVALLKERRAALISAAVTGKIDVRGLVDVPLEAA